MLRRGSAGRLNLAEFMEGETLDLSGKNVNSDFASDIENFLRQHPEITVLDLSDNTEVNGDFLRDLGASDNVRKLNITETGLSGTRGGDQLILYASSSPKLIEITGANFSREQDNHLKMLSGQRKPAYEKEMEIKTSAAEHAARMAEAERIKKEAASRRQEVEMKRQAEEMKIQEKVKSERKKIADALVGKSEEAKEVERLEAELTKIKQSHVSFNAEDDKQLLTQRGKIHADLKEQKKIETESQKAFDSISLEIKTLEIEIAKKESQVPGLESKEQEAKEQFKKQYAEIARKSAQIEVSAAAGERDLGRSVGEEANVREAFKPIEKEYKKAEAEVKARQEALSMAEHQFVGKGSGGNVLDKNAQDKWSEIKSAAKADYEKALARMKSITPKFVAMQQAIGERRVAVQQFQKVVDDLPAQREKLQAEKAALKEQERKEIQAFAAVREENSQLKEHKADDLAEAQVNLGKAKDQISTLSIKLQQVELAVQEKRKNRSQEVVQAEANLTMAKKNEEEAKAKAILENIARYLAMKHSKTSSTTIKAQLKVISEGQSRGVSSVDTLNKVKALGLASSRKSKLTRSKSVQEYLDLFDGRKKGVSFNLLFGPIKVVSPDVAKDILIHVEAFIVNSPTKMKLGMFGTEITLPDKRKKPVSEHSARHYDRIQQAKLASKDNPNAWLEALRDVTLDARSASLSNSIFRKKATHSYYAAFGSGREQDLSKMLHLESDPVAVVKAAGKPQRK